MPSTNLQVGRDASRRWRQRNPEKVREQKYRWYHKNKVAIRKRMLPGNLARAKALRLAVLAAFGWKCIRCGFDDLRALQVDHMNGGGCQERKRLRNQAAFNKKVLADQTGYQLLCANCNWIKRHERNEYHNSAARMAIGVIPRVKTTSTISED
jgi:hypothetical protein